MAKKKAKTKESKQTEPVAPPLEPVVNKETTMAVRGSHLPSVSDMEAAGSWGAENIDNEDIILPKVLLMQATSQLVHDGVASPGQFRDSLNKERKLGDGKNPVEFITFGSFKSWMELKNGEYNQMISYTPETSTLEREVQDGDDTLERKLVRSYYILLIDDIKNGEAFPYVVSAKGMSTIAGRTLATHMKMLQAVKKPTAAKVFKLSCHSDKNDKGSFHVLDIEKGRDSSQDELLAAFNWYKVLNTANVKVDNSDEKPKTEQQQSTKAF